MPVRTNSNTGSGAKRAARKNVFRNNALSSRTNRPSGCGCPPLGRNSSEHSTGISVIDTMNEAAMLIMVAMAMGANRRPSTPLNPSRGRKTRITNRVA